MYTTWTHITLPLPLPSRLPSLRSIAISIDSPASSALSRKVKKKHGRQTQSTSVPNRFHVSAYPRGVRFFDIADCDVKAGELIAKCDVKNWARWSAHSALCVY